MQHPRYGEAYPWYLGGYYGGGFAVKTKDHLLIFDKAAADDSPESGLANGRLNPHELAGQKITVLIAKIQGAASESRPYEIARRLPDVNLVVDSKPAEITGGLPWRRVAAPGERFSRDGVQVTASAVTGHGYGGAEGLAYLVEVDGLRILHAGFLPGKSTTSSPTCDGGIESPAMRSVSDGKQDGGQLRPGCVFGKRPLQFKLTGGG